MRPAALYIHIPFCWQRCQYCDFPSSVYRQEESGAYLVALASEFETRAARLCPQTIYIGGGTPTALSLDELAVLTGMVQQLDLAALTEWTVEANPGTVTMDKLVCLREAGVTRLSLGVQTFHPEGLKTLGRLHTARQARGALSLCREAGFDNISLDLIFGWPSQTESAWFDDLADAVALAPQHLSCYALSYEDGTPLARARSAGRLQPVAETVDRAMFDLAGAYLPPQGYKRYEISSFAREDQVCEHNLTYWSGGEYVGLGVGAHSYVEGTRFANAADAATYIDRMAHTGRARVWEEHLPPERAARERLVIGLRMTRGVDANAFAAETGFDLADLVQTELPELLQAGWLEWAGNHLRLTAKALPVADSILAELVV